MGCALSAICEKFNFIFQFLKGVGLKFKKAFAPKSLLGKNSVFLYFVVAFLLSACASGQPSGSAEDSQAFSPSAVPVERDDALKPPPLFLPPPPADRAETELWSATVDRARSFGAQASKDLEEMKLEPLPEEFLAAKIKETEKPLLPANEEIKDVPSKPKSGAKPSTEKTVDAAASSPIKKPEEKEIVYQRAAIPTVTVSRVYTTDDGLPSNSISSIYVDDEDAWIGTHLNGIARLNFLENNWIVVSEEDGLASNKITDIVKYDERIFVGTQEGINVWDGISWQTIDKFGGIRLINTVFKIHDGVLWVAARNMHGGLLTYSNGKWLDKSAIKAGNVLNNITNFDFDGGYFWIGTTNRGVYGFDGKNWKSFTVAHGLASNFVYALSSSEGKCYLGGCCGLSIYENDKWVVYDIAEGLPHSTVNVVEVDGKLVWVGTKKGLALFDGFDFIVFDQKNNFPDDRISDIFVRNEDVWVGTHNGLVRLEKSY